MNLIHTFLSILPLVQKQGYQSTRLRVFWILLRRCLSLSALLPFDRGRSHGFLLVVLLRTWFTEQLLQLLLIFVLPYLSGRDWVHICFWEGEKFILWRAWRQSVCWVERWRGSTCFVVESRFLLCSWKLSTKNYICAVLEATY